MDFRLVLDEAAIEDYADGSEVTDLMLDTGEKVADRARTLAPKLTGAGAASIHAEITHENGMAVAKVSWDKAHGYMSLQETGTEKMAPNPFLRPALDSTQI